MNIENIENNFDQKISESSICVIDFWAPWCGPCKMFGPIFENVSKRFNSVKFCKFNVDEDTKDITKKLGVMSIPTLIIFKDGIEVKRNVGFIDEDTLIGIIGEI